MKNLSTWGPYGLRVFAVSSFPSPLERDGFAFLTSILWDSMVLLLVVVWSKRITSFLHVSLARSYYCSGIPAVTVVVMTDVKEG